MPGRRQIEIDMIATKGDIVKDIIADAISQEIHNETGIACSKRENTEIRLNLIKLEQLVKTYDLNNKDKEFELYDYKEEKKKGKVLKDTEKLKTAEIIKTDLEYLRNLENEQRRAHAEKKKRGQLLRDRDEDSDI